MFILVHAYDDSKVFINTRFIDTFGEDKKGMVHVTTVASDSSITIKEPLDVFVQLLKKCNVDLEVSDYA